MMNAAAMKTEFKNETAGYFIHPKKFLLWLIIVASVMLFAAFTSAYIVRRGEGNWLVFDLPPMFSFTTSIIVLGSITMQLAYFFAKKDELNRVKI
ncbi:MAG: cytochrome oxidase subunit III, partial [Bacteroidia bacterium]